LGITRVAVARPVATIMAITFLLLLGGVSLRELPVDLLPEMTFPVVAVLTEYQGAGPHEVEQLVTIPIEKAVSAIGGLKRVVSESREGSSLVMAEFDWDTDMDAAAFNVREKVDLIRDYLPEGASNPIIIKADPSMLPILQLSLTGERDLEALTDLAERIIRPHLERIDGVASVTVIGGSVREIHVVADPQVLAAHGLDLARLSQLLAATNLSLPAGHARIPSQRFSVRVTGEFEDVQDLREVLVPTPAGTVLPLADLAEVRSATESGERLARLDGQRCVHLAIQKQSGANTVAVARQVRAALASLLRQLPPDVQLRTSVDQSEFITGAVVSVAQNGIVGGLLAAGILWAFLGNLASTAVIAIAIPVSVLATFILAFFAGVTLNLMSLGGLALGVGMLVDNAIVVLESITRHLQRSPGSVDAVIAGTEEVGGAVTASTLTTLVVFLPIFFITGLAAQLFRDLALTVSFAILSSLLISLSLVPMATARFSRVGMAQARASRWSLVEPVGRLLPRYRRLVRAALRRRRAVYAVVGVLVVATVLVFPQVGREFIPKLDRGEIRVEISLPPGTPLELTDALVRMVERRVSQLEDVESVFADVGGASGTGLGPGAAGTHSAQVLIKLRPRRASTTAEVVDDLRAWAAGIPGAEIRVKQVSGIVGEEEAFGAPLEVEIRGQDLEVLRDLGTEVMRRIQGVPGIRDLRSSVGEAAPELEIEVDGALAAARGLSVYQVAEVGRAALEGLVATRVRVRGEEYDVRVRAPERWRDPDLLEHLPVGAGGGGFVELGDLASFRFREGPVVIHRVGQVRSVSISADIAGRNLGDVVADVRLKLADLALPPGYTVEYGGEAREMAEAFGTLGYALSLSVILVYMVLAGQFELFLQPLLIMGTVPLAFVGVTWGLALTGRTLCVSSMIGAIALGGIVVNNAIVLVDYTNRLRRAGMGVEDAVVEAAVVRLRPIMMTTGTTVLGLLPLALGLGRGHELQAPLATAIIGGLLVSTLLTLVLVPALYADLEALRRRFARSGGR